MLTYEKENQILNENFWEETKIEKKKKKKVNQILMKTFGKKLILGKKKTSLLSLFK